MSIHKTAIVHPKAKLSSSVEIGPYSIIGEQVSIGARTKVGSHVVVDGITQIGEDCDLSPFCSIGLPPQDFKYKGEPTRVIVGNKNIFREYVTIHRGTPTGRNETVIGDCNYFMAYSHVAHDCLIGNHVVMANAAALGGHITIGDYAVLGGLVGVHQFVRIGGYAMIGGGAIVVQDVPPYLTASGNRAQLHGLNLVGLKRHRFSNEEIEALKRAYKLLFHAHRPLKEAVQESRNKWGYLPSVETFLSFIENSKRGICR
ncbi:MAG: acyl-ACP--UDP-N-acetylglucosamine O-acyltransferase [Nitrospirae bacterium]|nr:acyl-ACP--UDP-N-acetylglucosamine O-acyltransferase [Candidatus Troglogloeales bacterium]